MPHIGLVPANWNQSLYLAGPTSDGQFTILDLAKFKGLGFKVPS